MKIIIIALGIIIAVISYSIPLFKTGSRDISKLENIHGIPYPIIQNKTHIQEKLAHADVYLKEPVFAKELELTITFDPKDTKQIDVGVRENEFWLSYPKTTIYSKEDNKEIITKTITIPLTDKLQEKDRSIDIMFFADEKTEEDTSWILHNIQTNVKLTKPTNTKDYIRSIVKRERAL